MSASMSVSMRSERGILVRGSAMMTGRVVVIIAMTMTMMMMMVLLLLT